MWFTIDNLAAYLNADRNLPAVGSTTAPFDQVVQVLLDENMECWRKKRDFMVVWTRPERVSTSFAILH